MSGIAGRYKAARLEHQDAIIEDYADGSDSDEDVKAIALRALASNENIEDGDLYADEVDDEEEVTVVRVKKPIKKPAKLARFSVKKKNKTSQADNSVSNSFAFKDNSNDVIYNVSVTITTHKPGTEGELAPDNLRILQKHVSEFVSDIHTKL